MRKTKIICTLGPATDREEVLRDLVRGGMDLARFNFSHGSHEEQLNRLNTLRRICKEEGKNVATLLDTKGPEIRTKTFVSPPVQLVEGAEVVIRHEDVEGSEKEFSVTYKDLHKDIEEGGRILIDDGLVELLVRRIDMKTGDIHCVIRNGGSVSNHKSINIPNTNIQLPALTEKDISDLQFAVNHDMDFIAASFVRKASDVVEIRHHLEMMGNNDIRIIAKIENQEGIDNFEQILFVSDGIMVARGDLGVEIPAFRVPIVQKQLIRQCYRFGKPVITATQMLDSMMRNPRPTRAEVSDVANAILDGTSAIMLSGETAAGKYPLDAFSMMKQIAEEMELKYDYWDFFKQSGEPVEPTVGSAISHACCTTAMDLKAKAIVTMSLSGRTARLISRFRPGCPIIATASNEKVVRQLQLSWGVVPYYTTQQNTADDIFAGAVDAAVNTGLVSTGDVVVITCGTPVGLSGTTNTLKIQNIGNVLCQGTSMGTGIVSKEVINLTEGDGKELLKRRERFIIVADRTTNEMMPILRHAAGIIVVDPDPNSHTITVGKALDIPVIYDCNNSTKILHTGMLVSMDMQSGLVS